MNLIQKSLIDKNKKDNFHSSFQQGILNWEPQIAILCNENGNFYPQYTSDKGYWKTYTDVQKEEFCPDEANIFKLCKKVNH